MFSFEQDYISVTMSEVVLKIAHFRLGGSTPRLLNIFKKDIKDVPEEERLQLVQSAMATLNLKRVRGICVVPSGMATTKNIEIPSVDPQEIKSIIDLQAGRHTPYAREEILVGYINIGVHERNYTKILLIIVNRQIIKKQLAIFEQANIKVDKVLFAPEGKASFYGEFLHSKEHEIPSGIIDIGKQTTDFIVEAKGLVITCRSIPLGLEHLIKEGETARDKLINELVASVETYQNEDIYKPPETFVLTSDDAKIKDLQPILQEKLKITVKVVSYLDHITATQPVMLKIVSEFDDESFLDTMAPLLTLKNIQVDLTPDEVKVQRAIEEKGHQVVQAGILIIILLLLVCSIFFAKIYFHNQYLLRLTDEYHAKRKIVEELEEISTNTRIVKNYLHSRMLSLEIVHELYAKIPDEIYLKNLTVEEDGTIHLQGISESRSTAFAFVTILEDSPLFKKAKMISSNAQKDRGKDVSAFEIAFKLESVSDEASEEETSEEVVEKKEETAKQGKESKAAKAE